MEDKKKGTLKEVWRFVKFAIFSASAGIIEIVIFTLLNEFTNLGYWSCYLPALVLSVVWNYTLNRRYAFKAEGNYAVQLLRVAIFYAVFTPLTTIGGNWLAEDVGWNEYLVTALNMVLNFGLEFLYDRFVVFRGVVDTNELARKEEGEGADSES